MDGDAGIASHERMECRGDVSHVSNGVGFSISLLSLISMTTIRPVFHVTSHLCLLEQLWSRLMWLHRQSRVVAGGLRIRLKYIVAFVVD